MVNNDASTQRFAWGGAIGAPVIPLLVIWRPPENIRNLIAGTEGRIGGSSRS